MRAILIRTKMHSKDYSNSYDVYIPIEEVKQNACGGIRTTWRGNTYIDPVEVFITDEHRGMQGGYAKLKDFYRIENVAKAWKLKILKEHFKEISHLKEYPMLWVNHKKDYESKNITINVEL